MNDLQALPLDVIERVRARTVEAIRPALRRQLTRLLADPDVVDPLVVANREGWPIRLMVHVEVPEAILEAQRAQRVAALEEEALLVYEASLEALSPDERLRVASSRPSREERVAVGLQLLVEAKSGQESGETQEEASIGSGQTEGPEGQSGGTAEGA